MLRPSRQVTRRWASCGKAMASAFTATGSWPGSRRSRVGRTPRPDQGLGDNGAVPCRIQLAGGIAEMLNLSCIELCASRTKSVFPEGVHLCRISCGESCGKGAFGYYSASAKCFINLGAPFSVLGFTGLDANPTSVSC